MEDRYEDGIPRESRRTGFLQSFDRQKLDPRDSADFASKLLSFVRQNKVAADALIAGNVQMLGFETLKERFGDQWHGIKDKVHLLTEGVIKKHITADDVYCLLSDDRFVVLFGKATKADANRTAQAIGRDVNARLSGAGAGADAVSVRPMVFEMPRDDPAALRSPKALDESVEDAQRRAQAAEVAKVDAAKDRLRMRFWPIANVRKRLVSLYHADLHVPDGTDLGFDLSDISDTGAVEATIDRLVLQKAGTALIEAASQRWRALLIAPVHYDTLATKSYRTQYLEVCRLLPRIAEKRLFLMVRGLSDDVPQGRLHTLFSYLGPFVAGFIGDFSPAFRRAEKLGGVRMVAIGVDGHAMAAPTAKDVEGLRAFVVGNKGARMRRYFYGASTFEAATAARRARFDYVQGAGVAPAMPVAGKVFRV